MASASSKGDIELSEGMPHGYDAFPHTAINLLGEADLLRKLMAAWEEMIAMPTIRPRRKPRRG